MAFCKQAKVKKLIAQVDDRMQVIVDESLQLTSTIKDYIDNPLTITVAALTPTKIDDDVLHSILQYLDKVLVLLGLVSKVNHYSNDQLLQFIASYLHDVPQPFREAILIKIAQLITCLRDDRYSQSFYDSVVQDRYLIANKN